MDFSHQKTVEFTFEKRRGEMERRVYVFDAIQDRMVEKNRMRFLCLILG